MAGTPVEIRKGYLPNRIPGCHLYANILEGVEEDNWGSITS